MTFRQGVKRAFIYYFVGVVSSLLTYAILGWKYIHGPAPFHLVAGLFVLGGIGWLLRDILGISKPSAQGSSLVHVVVVLILSAYFVWEEMRWKQFESTMDKIPEQTIIITKKSRVDTTYTKTEDSLVVEKSSK